MDKEELLKEKKEKGAKYCWVDNRYNNRHLFLYSDNQKEALFELLEKKRFSDRRVFPEGLR